MAVEAHLSQGGNLVPEEGAIAPIALPSLQSSIGATMVGRLRPGEVFEPIAQPPLPHPVSWEGRERPGWLDMVD